MRSRRHGDRSRRTSPPACPCSITCSALLARARPFDLALEVAPADAEAEVAAAGRALGEALAAAAARDGAPGHGSAFVPADEALAQVALEASGRPLLVSNVDLSEARAGGLRTDLAARFLEARRRRRADAARPPDRRRGLAARARGDLQGARRRARAGVPAGPDEPRRIQWQRRRSSAPSARPRRSRARRTTRRSRSGELVFVAGQLGAAPGRAGDGRRRRSRSRPSRSCTNLRGDPRGGRERPGPARQDDRLPAATSTTSRAMNEVYARHVGERPPARSTVEVASFRPARSSRSRRSRTL